MNVRDSKLFQCPIAHRGLHNELYPENSVGAFEHAIEGGFPIEIDVRIISDGTVAVFHDYKLSRMCGVDGYISTLDKTSLKNTRLLGTDYSIPTLSETFECIGGKVPLLIEIKNEDSVGGLERALAYAIKNYKGEVAVQSFNPYSLGYFASVLPETMRGQLSTFFDKRALKSFVKRFALKRLLLNDVSKPHFISYGAEFLPNRFVTKTALPVLAWTIRSEEQAKKARTSCDNIIFEKFIPSKNE